MLSSEDPRMSAAVGPLPSDPLDCIPEMAVKDPNADGISKEDRDNVPLLKRVNSATVYPESDISAVDTAPLLKRTPSKMECPTEEVTTAIPVVAAAGGGSASWNLKRAQGLGFIVFAAFNFSIVAACVKFSSRYMSSHETVFWRMSIGLAINSIWLRVKQRNLTVEPKNRGILLFRCLVGTLGTSMSFYAMSEMVLTDAVVIIFTSPIFTFILGSLVLGEGINRADFFGSITSFVGVLFVTRPAFLFPVSETATAAPPLAVMCAVGSSISAAIVYIAIRKMNAMDNLVVIHYFMIFGTIFALLSLWFFDVTIRLPLEPSLFLAIIGSGFFSYVGQIFLTMGFQREKAGIASVMRYFDVVFVLVWDVVFLDEHVNHYSVFGAAIIIGGALVIVLRRIQLEK